MQTQLKLEYNIWYSGITRALHPEGRTKQANIHIVARRNHHHPWSSDASLVVLRVEDSMVNSYVFTSLRGDVSLLWQTRLVQTLSGLDDLVQPTRNLGRRHASAKYIARRDRRAIESLVGVLAFNENRAL